MSPEELKIWSCGNLQFHAATFKPKSAIWMMKCFCLVVRLAAKVSNTDIMLSNKECLNQLLIFEIRAPDLVIEILRYHAAHTATLRIPL